MTKDVLGLILSDAIERAGMDARVVYTCAPGKPPVGTPRVVAFRTDTLVVAYFQDGAPLRPEDI